MIKSLANQHQKKVAVLLLSLFYFQLLGNLYAATATYNTHANISTHGSSINSYFDISTYNHKSALTNIPKALPTINKNSFSKSIINTHIVAKRNIADIGGPSAPEATSFKAVGSDNLVNLFTGDFSYSIPLLDVGGYPVNLFYTGGISMEQEASWVGLGWNINAGSVTRNMRGIPDDFNGEDILIQRQNTKPNRTWGGEIGADLELIGLKKPKISASLGVSYNNYLGPAIELGAKTSISLLQIPLVSAEKGAPMSLAVDLGIGAKLSSRSGLTFTPSLNAKTTLDDKGIGLGVGLSTNYNSRTGIKELNIHSELSFYKAASSYTDPDTKITTQYGATNISASIGSSTISFAKPTYMPTMRMPMENVYYSGQLEFGGGLFGFRGSLSGMGYYSESSVPSDWQVIQKPLVGFIFSEKAYSNKNAVMDFNRINDAEVTPNTPVISAPQYAYDVFSIQGEGTGGTIRAYRGSLGFMRDNITTSRDKNISLGVDIAPPGHYGGNWNITSTPTKVGGWDDLSNKLLQTMQYTEAEPNQNSYENVYFKNPGEATVTNTEVLSRLGNDDLTRFKLGGSNVNATLESTLETFDKKTGTPKNNLPINSKLDSREKRTQVITMLSAKEASDIGLDKYIKNYNLGFSPSGYISSSLIARVGDFRKAHHISEIDVLEQSGMRYVYGLPVYNLVQKDFTFSVGNVGNASTNISQFTPDEPTTNSRHMANKAKIDGYFQSQETPAYASSFLITGLISPDYVDVNGDGITEDDLGNAVKFNYTKSDDIHRWRTPRENSVPNTSHFNVGLKTNPKDNKATISYGEREVWYMNSIESKSMIAVFTTEDRNDAKGVRGEMDGRVNATEKANKRLKQIDLYTKAEIRTKGFTNATPLKTVHFEYCYQLCKGTPDNANANEGKLTLKSVYFSYNGQSRLSKDKYVFNYGDSTKETDNPTYHLNYSDRWGSYKNPVNNPSGLNNIDYSYTINDSILNKSNAGAWNLKKILLPSGGQMEIEYESDDYGYVQNKRACDMFQIYGLGNSKNYSTSNSLYEYTSLPQPSIVSNPLLTSFQDNMFVYVKAPNAVAANELIATYLQDIKQLAFKLQVNMPNSASYGTEPLTVYAECEEIGICNNSTDKTIIYLKLAPRDGQSPLAKSAISFLVNNLPAQAFEGYDVEVDGIAAFVSMASSLFSSIQNAFTNVDEQMRKSYKAKSIDLSKSFVRLNNPSIKKYGGGYRVKKVVVRDNWAAMTGQYTSTYGQEYDYTTTEKINGKEKIISSGVASYEPGIGSEENPFREILSYSNKLPAASAEYGAIEMPMLEALYPSPSVGYSKVTVRSIHRNGTHNDSIVRSGIGKQVSEFYTAKDYPTFSAYTNMSDMQYHKNPFLSFFFKEVMDRRTISQGFLVETNDMHGKMKSQAAYSESDEKNPLSYSYKTYKNTGKNGLNDKVDFVFGDEGGVVKKGNMGIDVELMTDVREFKVESDGFNGQAQVDIFPFGIIIITLPTIWPLKTYVENRYRAVTCTKLINYHAIEDVSVVIDKGSQVSTQTIAYDAETGAAIVTKTNNEFNDPIYNTTYPAHWAYSGVSGAYKNIGTTLRNVNFIDGKISLTQAQQNQIFESGDELYITQQSNTVSSCIAPSDNAIKIWAYDSSKNSTALTQNNKNLIFMDAAGKIFTKGNVTAKIVRSGKRNNAGLQLATAVCMANPIQNVGGTNKLIVNNTTNVVSSSAIEYKEKWQNENDVFLKTKVTSVTDNNCNTTISEYPSCDGQYQKHINPYTTGLIGNFKPVKSYVYDGNRESYGAATDIRKNGYIDNFSNFWNFNGVNNLVPDYTNIKWVWNSQLTKINSKGQELETKDPLNRYTAAQYGFEKNMPVAMTQNARYGQSFAESFEDRSFAENINAIVANNCIEKYLDFDNLTNAAILDATSKILKFWSPSQQVAVHLLGINKIDVFCTNSITNTIFKVGNIVKITGADNPANNISFKVISITPFASSCGSNGGFTVLTDANFIETDGWMEVPNFQYIIETPKPSFNAHSGKYVLKTTANTIKQLPINDNVMDNYSMGIEQKEYNRFTNYSSPGYYNQYNNAAFGKLGLYYAPTANNLSNPIYYNVNYRNQPLMRPVDAYLSSGMNCEACSTNSYPNYFAAGSDGGQSDDSRRGTAEPILLSGSTTAYADYPIFLEQTFFKPSATANYTLTLELPYNTGKAQFIIREIPCEDDLPDYWIPSTILPPPFNPPFDYLKSITVDGGFTSLSSNPVSFANKVSQTVTCYFDNNKYYQLILIYQSNSINLRNGINSLRLFKCCTAQKEDRFLPLAARVGGFKLTDNFYNTRTISRRCKTTSPLPATDSMLNPTFSLTPGSKMLISAWVREECTTPCTKTTYNGTSGIALNFGGADIAINPTGAIIDGWQKVEGEFTVPATGAATMQLKLLNSSGSPNYWDDIRIQPYNSNMKSYVYDDRTLKLTAELDENNYASFYEYDEEGQLVRVKKETAQGIKTIKETRSSKQKLIKDVQ